MSSLRRLRTTVGIVGAGPSGLFIGNALAQRGIDCIVIDRATREGIEARPRAGFIEPRVKDLIVDAGLGEKMLALGEAHGHCEFRTPGHSFVFDYASLAGGREHWVYQQQDLVSDFTDLYLEAGGEIHFGWRCVDVRDHESPRLLCEDTATGELVQLECDVLAGCDGYHGAVRASLPYGALACHAVEHPFQWIAMIAEAPPSDDHTIYVVHPDGYAAHMQRTPTASRYYLQTARGDMLDDWPEERIWAELRKRFAAEGFALVEGPLSDRTIVALRSAVFEPVQHGRTLLVGDAAHIIPPCGAKGMNLALMDAAAFVELVERHLAGDAGALAEYSQRRLPDIWRAHEYSHWLLHMLSVYDPGEGSGYAQGLQAARLRNLEHHPEFAAHFATGYVGPE